VQPGLHTGFRSWRQLKYPKRIIEGAAAAMPFITVKVLEGKTVEQKRKLVRDMTKVVCDSFDVEPDRVFIFIEDLEKDNYGKQGQLFSDLEGQH
jgi:4-oxalocrotonate tautomerase